MERRSPPRAGRGDLSPGCGARRSSAEDRAEREDSVGKGGQNHNHAVPKREGGAPKSSLPPRLATHTPEVTSWTSPSESCGALAAPPSGKKRDKGEGSAGRGAGVAVASVPGVPPLTDWQVLCRVPGEPSTAPLRGRTASPRPRPGVFRAAPTADSPRPRVVGGASHTSTIWLCSRSHLLSTFQGHNPFSAQ